MSQQVDDLICVGHILGAQGLKGLVRIYSATSPRENLVNYSPWILDRGGSFEAVAVSGRLQGKNVLASLEGIENRDQADELIGCQIYIRPDQLPPLGEDDYYWTDLVGLAVENLQGEALGVVASMIETGADDVMVLQGDRERLIPFVLGQIVHKVDLDSQRLVVDWSAEY